MSDLTAILLCGGKGERLRPYTEHIPKALISLHGVPLLEHLLKHLEASGIRRFVVCTGYKAELIEQFIKESRAGRDVTLVDSGDASMTDRILDARRHIPSDGLICYGDTLANVDLAALRRQHQASGRCMTMTVYPLQSPFGIVLFNEADQVRSFAEKPQLPYWINIGFMYCAPTALERVRRGSDMATFLSSMAATGEMGVYRHTGKHLTINTEKERVEAESQIIEFFTVLGE
jgi:glucose-1-phosphate cytidylyltransferase